jgi:hypothetical protein
MLSTAAICFGAGLFAFVVWTLVVSVERKKGRRIFLSRFRGWLDHITQRAFVSMSRRWRHFARYIVQLNWYYSLHAMLQAFLKVIVGIYHYFERLFEQNRKKAKRLRAEKRKLKTTPSHLEEVATHKEETALSPAARERLMKKKLESDH